MNVYSFAPVTDCYSLKEMRDFSSKLEDLGFSYQQGQFGGGQGDIPKQIIIWLSVNSDWISSVANLTLLISFAGKWYKKSRKPQQKRKVPVINISIYCKDIYKSSIEVNISKDYTKTEIKKIVDALDID